MIVFVLCAKGQLGQRKLERPSGALYHPVALYVNQWLCYFHSISSMPIRITLWIPNHQTPNHLGDTRNNDENSRKVNKNHCQSEEAKRFLKKQIHSDLGISILKTSTKFHTPILNRRLAGLTFARYCSAINGQCAYLLHAFITWQRVLLTLFHE